MLKTVTRNICVFVLAAAIVFACAAVLGQAVTARAEGAATISEEQLAVRRERGNNIELVFAFTMNDDSFPETGALSGCGITSGDYRTGKDTIAVNGSFMAALEIGTYVLTLKTNLNTVGFTACIEITPKAAQIIFTEKDYDKANKSDVVFSFAMRDDRIVSVLGNGIASKDYSVSGNNLTIKSQYLSQQSAGEKKYIVTTRYNPRGIELIVNVNSGSLLFGRTVTDYRINTDGAVFGYTLDDDCIMSVAREGKPITVENYVAGENSLFIRGGYLDKLSAGTYSFTVNSLMRTVQITVNVLPAAEFSDGDETLEKNPDQTPSEVEHTGCSGAAALNCFALSLPVVLLAVLILFRKKRG